MPATKLASGRAGIDPIKAGCNLGNPPALDAGPTNSKSLKEWAPATPSRSPEPKESESALPREQHSQLLRRDCGDRVVREERFRARV